MRQIQFSLYDPPEEIRSGAALTQENMLRSRPFAAIFTDDTLKEICRLYGYLMLLGQNLEVELRVCPIIPQPCSSPQRRISPFHW